MSPVPIFVTQTILYVPNSLIGAKSVHQRDVRSYLHLVSAMILNSRSTRIGVQNVHQMAVRMNLG